MPNLHANRVAILTPSATGPNPHHGGPPVLARLDAALAHAGIEATATPWTDHADDGRPLLEYPLVLPLLAWGYHLEHARWLHACRTWAPEALALARQVLDAIGAPLLYARIDLVPGADGRWLLMEAELIEPDLYLGQAPDAGAAFADAVRALLAASRLDHLPAIA
jgi:hypothetical protein